MTRQQMVARGLTVALMLGTAACGSDRVASPGDAAPTQRFAKGTGTGGTSGKTIEGEKLTTFVVKPNRSGRFTINGGHRLDVAANAICDPATSGYGPTLWETSCHPIRSDLTITALSGVDAAGHPYVRFSPDLRFTPDDSRPVTLAMFDRAAVESGGNYVILYCASGSTTCVDESLADPELKTYTDNKNLMLYRRIKHFSGYNIVSGRTVVEAY